MPVKRLLASDPEFDEINRLNHALCALANRHMLPFDHDLELMTEVDRLASIVEVKWYLEQLLRD